MDRTFVVLIKGKRSRVLTLPCKGFSSYSGEEALKVMESYRKNRPKLLVVAETSGKYSGTEQLTLEEMRELFS